MFFYFSPIIYLKWLGLSGKISLPNQLTGRFLHLKEASHVPWNDFLNQVFSPFSHPSNREALDNIEAYYLVVYKNATIYT